MRTRTRPRIAIPRKDQLLRLHHVGWRTTWVWFGFLAGFAVSEALLAWSLVSHRPVLAILFVALSAHLMHSHLIAFHEAAHGTLSPSRWCNGAIGFFIGVLSFMSLSLYRAAHHTHHAYLATERDEELWPFVVPTSPLWLRRLAAACELLAGLFYTPCLFLRAFLKKDSPIQREDVRRRIWQEMAALFLFWIGALAAAAHWNAWTYLLVLYLVPAFLAGNIQSLRKYTEHMGLTGPTSREYTRSVAPSAPLGALFTFSLFNVSFHAIHHEYPRLPEAALPKFAGQTNLDLPGLVFPSYFAACLAMLPTLRDPRIGAQWLPSRQTTISRSTKLEQ